jgi:glycosyltransferase involved in cell wall biosynthesis
LSPKGLGPIIHMHDRLSARGGADRHLLGILEHLQNDLSTELWVGNDDGSLPEAEKSRIGNWLRLKGLERSGLNQRGKETARQRIVNALEQRRPKVIHIHNVMDPGVLKIAANIGPAVLTVQDHRCFCPGQGKIKPNGRLCSDVMGKVCFACFDDSGYANKLLELTKARLRAAAKMRLVLVLSNYMASELLAAWRAEGLTPPKIEVLPPFVHGLRSLPRQGAGEYHLLASRLVERKGVLQALNAVSQVEMPLWVAGDGAMRAQVEQAAKESGGKIRYLGWADRENMSRLLSGACSLWLPSLWAEPFGIAGLEAMSVGVPVIASRVGGISEWLEHGRGGYMVPQGDASALAAAARRLEQDPDLAQEIGLTGAERVKRDYAPGSLMEELKEFYNQVQYDQPGSQ